VVSGRLLLGSVAPRVTRCDTRQSASERADDRAHQSVATGRVCMLITVGPMTKLRPLSRASRRHDKYVSCMRSCRRMQYAVCGMRSCIMHHVCGMRLLKEYQSTTHSLSVLPLATRACAHTHTDGQARRRLPQRPGGAREGFLKSGVRLCHARLGSLLLKLRGVESALQLHRLCLARGQLLA